MSISVCGISHKTAPVELREKLFFAKEKLGFYLQDLINNENIREAVLLSTCNRSEIYCDTEDLSSLKTWFSRQHQIPLKTLEPLLYTYSNEHAIKHIMKVACGLDSMILGEPQILGQMKEAFSEAVASGSVKGLFNRLFQHVFSVAKEVRTNTAIGACPVSISSSAVNLIAEQLSLKDASVLVLGAGDTIQLVLRYLKIREPKKITIINRSLENARTLAEQFQIEEKDFSELKNILNQVDVVISATGSATPLITKDLLIPREKPLCIVDIAVPRDVAADVSELSQVKLFSIDDLKNTIQHNLQGREHAAEKALEMIEQQSLNFMRWQTSVDEVAKTISAYRKQMEELCQTELLKHRRLLHRGDDPVEVLNQFALSLTNKLLHHPSIQLRQAGVEGRLDLLELARELFALPKPEVELS